MKSGSLACLLLVLLLVAAVQECRAQSGKTPLASQQAASAFRSSIWEGRSWLVYFHACCESLPSFLHLLCRRIISLAIKSMIALARLQEGSNTLCSKWPGATRASGAGL